MLLAAMLLALSPVAAGTQAPVHAPGNYDAATTIGSEQEELGEMLALYRRLCFVAFPDDAAVAGQIAQLHATAMTPMQVADLLHQDPGIGWYVQGRHAIYMATIEAPPFHACGVRANFRAGVKDHGPYRTLVEEQAKRWPAREVLPARSIDQGGVRTTTSAEGSRLPDGTSELLIEASAEIVDPAPPAGRTGVEVRFVRQFTGGQAPK